MATIDQNNAADKTLSTAKSAGLARVVSLDAYRGFVMLLMMGEVLEFDRVSRAIPDSAFWKFLCHHQSHVAWVGCSLHDLIQPSFSFLVGAALPFSLARRAASGQTELSRSLHAFWRALVLVLLGVFLRSVGQPQTNWTFEDTLTQIGLGYGFLYLLALRSPRTAWYALGGILLGYWFAFALYPLPGPAFDWSKAGVSADWPNHLSGFAAHWNKNTNAAWAFDVWFMNLFSREHPFTANGGGYSTLSFIPTLGTMILGLIAGRILRSESGRWSKLRWFVLLGVGGLILGWVLGAIGLCPVVKRIWTPSWVLFSGGWCFLLLGGFSAVLDEGKCRARAFPLVVVGMNSIAAYLIAHLFPDFIEAALPRHLGAGLFSSLGAAYRPLLLGAGVLAIEWVMLWWMFRRKIFLRI